MTAAGGELIHNPENKAGSLRRLSFRSLLDGQGGMQRSPAGENFVRYMPNGRLAVVEKPVEVPEVPAEEIQRRRMEAMEREAYQKVFAAAEQSGLEMGEQKMEREINRLLPQLESILRELAELPARVLAAAEGFVIEMLLTLTRELLAHEISINPEEIAHRVQRIMKHAAGRKEITIRVSPEYAVILGRMDSLHKLRIQGDETVAPGSVVMDSDFGGLEDNLEVQMRDVEIAIRTLLQERLQNMGIAEITEAAAQRTARAVESAISPLVGAPVQTTPKETATITTSEDAPPDSPGVLSMQDE